MLTSVSLNEHTLHALEQFKVITDFIKNPGNFESLVAQAKEILEHHKAVLHDLTEAQELAEYRAKVLSECSKAKADLESAHDHHTSTVAVKQKQLSDHTETLTQKAAELAAKESELLNREKHLVPMEKALQEKHALVDSKVKDLAKYEAELKVREQELADKAAKIKMLIG